MCKSKSYISIIHPDSFISLEEIKESGWIIDMYDFDLHKNGPAKDNIMTEYEEKFSIRVSLSVN